MGRLLADPGVSVKLFDTKRKKKYFKGEEEGEREKGVKIIFLEYSIMLML